MCVSVKSHLTSGTSVRPENTACTQQATKVKICGVFSEARDLLLPPFKAIRKLSLKCDEKLSSVLLLL